MRMFYEFSLPTKADKVPPDPTGFTRSKYDGYRLMVIRDGARVRLFSRNGNDWSGRYPWIVEAALKNNHDQFVIDGEAVVLGVDGIADFNALHSRTMPRSSSTPSTSSHSMVRTCAACRCRCGRPIWRGCSHVGRTASS